MLIVEDMVPFVDLPDVVPPLIRVDLLEMNEVQSGLMMESNHRNTKATVENSFEIVILELSAH